MPLSLSHTLWKDVSLTPHGIKFSISFSYDINNILYIIYKNNSSSNNNKQQQQEQQPKQSDSKAKQNKSNTNTKTAKKA